MTDSDAVVIRREDQIIIQPTIVVEPEITMPLDFDPRLEMTIRTNSLRRDVILAFIALVLLAHLFV